MSSPPPSLQTIAPHHPIYPIPLQTCSAFKTPPTLYAIGKLGLLSLPSIAFFCSSQCPGDLILKTYDLAQALRDANIPVISGFHSPIEQDCLTILLRGTQPIIHCLARSLHNLRLSAEQQQAIAQDRLLLISPFSASYSRATTQLADKRNRLISAIAPVTFMAYAAPDSHTLAFAQQLLQEQRTIKTFEDSVNVVLHQQGIAGLESGAIVRLVSAV
jgi:predicted Rossmann fold nucleotide-binding protein DprA/Smf involved in DNA uptake